MTPPTYPSPAIDWIVPLLFFYKDGFDIKYPIKVDVHTVE